MDHVIRTPTPGVHETVGYRHVARVGHTLYLSGQIAKAVDGSVVGVGDVDAQARQVFANLEAVLASQGAGLGDIVKWTIYLTDRASIAPFRAVRASLVGERVPPSTLVIVEGLAEPELLIEIEAIAVVPASADR